MGNNTFCGGNCGFLKRPEGRSERVFTQVRERGGHIKSSHICLSTTGLQPHSQVCEPVRVRACVHVCACLCACACMCSQLTKYSWGGACPHWSQSQPFRGRKRRGGGSSQEGGGGRSWGESSESSRLPPSPRPGPGTSLCGAWWPRCPTFPPLSPEAALPSSLGSQRSVTAGKGSLVLRPVPLLGPPRQDCHCLPS